MYMYFFTSFFTSENKEVTNFFLALIFFYFLTLHVDAHYLAAEYIVSCNFEKELSIRNSLRELF